jgi:hypothetical protein
MKEHLTPSEVWLEFWTNVGSQMKPIENELHQADRTFRGEVKRKSKKGVRVVTLGADRIKRLVEKYAPGRYEYHEGEPYFTRKE